MAQLILVSGAITITSAVLLVDIRKFYCGELLEESVFTNVPEFFGSI